MVGPQVVGPLHDGAASGDREGPGIAATRVNELVTVQYAKVAEEQHRAAIHFHALIRLDGAQDPRRFRIGPPSNRRPAGSQNSSLKQPAMSG